VNEKSSDQLLTELVLAAGRPPSVTLLDDPEPEPLFCPIISADDHLLEPPHLFVDRLPSRLAEQAPYVTVDSDGFQWWIVEGQRVPNLLLNGASGRPISEWGDFNTHYDEMRRGVWDPAVRLQDMDLAGVWASLCFPSTLWGFAGTRFARMTDHDLGLACLRAYNDWMVDEWVGTDPRRYIACQLPWLADPVLAADEIRRNAARGVRSVSFSENPEGIGLPNIYSDHWDPFFSACEETATVVNLHVGSSGMTRRPCSSSKSATLIALFPESGIEALVDWVFARVPVRFPDLKVVLSEAGVSWVPMALERLGRAERSRGSVLNDWDSDLPSPVELARRSFYFTSIEDPSAFRQLDLIGEDRVMVETDYPHYDSTWPACQAMIRGQLSGLDPTVIRKVCFENAAAVYGHPLPPAEMIARSEVAHFEVAPVL
jgi:predicted TIM-barrel fold metal-dependent hydrolase